jgi:hypothetical protein
MATLRLVPASGPPVEIDGESALVGRDANVDVLVNDASVSRKHARLERWGSNWAVVDQRSANGTFLDGERVTESVVRSGQELRFGKVTYRVELSEPEFGATMVMGSSPLAESTLVQPAAERPRPAAPAPAPPPAPRPAPRPAAPPPSVAPAPAPYVAPVPEPEPERKGIFRKVFLALVGLALLGALGAAVVLLPSYLKSKDAVAAARTQLKAIADGDMEAAYAQNTASYQAAHPASAFGAFVERHPGLKRNTGSDFETRTVESGRAKLAGTLSHAGGTESVVYELEKEGEAWRVSGIEVEGEEAPVASAPAATGTEGGGLVIETIAVNKTKQGQTITVKIDIRVKGFDLRPEGRAFRVDLAEDLETFGADGKRIDELSRSGLETYNQTTKSAADATATFNTSLTFSQPEPGRYKAVITIRDMVGLKSKKHEVPFDLP